MFNLGLVNSRCSGFLVPNLARYFINRAVNRPIPPQNDLVATPQDFLKKIGRGMDTKLSVESWDQLWTTSGLDMRKLGLSVRDRRYTLWCMEKFRRGVPIEEFAHEPKPKKTIRSWGPSVQNGKRIRSRRLKNKHK
ncbi:hypothetical protein K435DRAFT_650454 [Dendrothele bispora CBS 962.96]|uniref:Small ribosomal subunit protein mS41 n=1 Tax=Dendrothele bispora (strain CBS 962.96) TaxID=1314807 RepID=A0A4S8MLX7_DENBC|nr:hypothetical protein K435DRAFT_650454 [Dendrothele bispora CBS 962.96]